MGMLMPPLLLLLPLMLMLMLTTATTAMDTDMVCLMAMDTDMDTDMVFMDTLDTAMDTVDTAITMARGLLMLMLMLMLTTATTVMDTDMAMVDTPTTDNLFLPKRDPYSTTIYNHCYTWSHGIHPDLSVNHQSCNSCKNWLFQFVILLHQC